VGLFYERARVEANLTLAPALLFDICARRAQSHATTTFVVDEHKLLLHPERPYRTTTLRCDRDGLRTLSTSRPR
jgi:hypothetical protein